MAVAEAFFPPQAQVAQEFKNVVQKESLVSKVRERKCFQQETKSHVPISRLDIHIFFVVRMSLLDDHYIHESNSGK